LYNDHHLNSKGAVKFTKYFSKYLSENYHFEDKRGQEAYHEWDEAYDLFVAFYDNGWKNLYTKVGGSNENEEDSEETED